MRLSMRWMRPRTDNEREPRRTKTQAIIASHEFFQSFLILNSLLAGCWLFFLQSFKVHSRTKHARVAGVRHQKAKYVINPEHFIISQMVIIKMTMTITFINELGAILLRFPPPAVAHLLR